ncbi:tryptorubin family RiPP precursor [Streptomyces sp. NBC_01497]|uniref:tryptorubin family RiPP precursor n=1 Tax=Streptomyces sp. NBC_01497 TaxID=2903885 RepID=UPI002E3016C0|nr:tryptorubin family RiPP precursor [Streptomyces sp. NBC_01497]
MTSAAAGGRLDRPTAGTSTVPIWEVLMKFVRLVKKMRSEKSLKAYAWYGWI